MTLAAPTKEEVYPWLVDILHEMFGLDKSKITTNANLYSDLDIDSIDAVDLILRLKDLTGRKIQPQTFKNVRTVGDVVDAIENLMASSAS